MILKEFKTFLRRGNIIDLAAAVVMGSAFTRIVSSFISDLLNPLLILVTRDTDLKNLSLSIGKATFNYGSFLQATFDFLTISFFLFVFVYLARKVALKVEERIIDPVDEKIVTPLEKKILGKEIKTDLPDQTLNKDAIISQVQENLKNKQKHLQ